MARRSKQTSGAEMLAMILLAVIVFVLSVGTPIILLICAVWKLAEYYQQKNEIKSFNIDSTIPVVYESKSFWLNENEKEELKSKSKEREEIEDEIWELKEKGDKIEIPRNVDGTFSKRSYEGKALQESIDNKEWRSKYLWKRICELEVQPQTKWRQTKQKLESEWKEIESVWVKASNTYCKAYTYAISASIGFIVWLCSFLWMYIGSEVQLDFTSKELLVPAIISISAYLFFYFIIKLSVTFPIKYPEPPNLPEYPSRVDTENIDSYVMENNFTQANTLAINSNLNNTEPITINLNPETDTMKKKHLDTYYEVCNKFNTNLRNIFDYLSSDYKDKDDNYRFVTLSKIIKAKYDLHEILDGYKIDYIQNNEKPYVVDALPESIIYLLKDGTSMFGMSTISKEEIHKLERDIMLNLRAVSENELLDPLITFLKLTPDIKKIEKPEETKPTINNLHKTDTMEELKIMNNPWEQILNKRNLFVIDADKQAIEKFNEKASDDYKIHTDLPPEPYIGNPITADIFLLALNPGYAGDEKEYLSKNPTLYQALLNNLIHQNIDYPLFFFEERFNDSPGAKWWERILKPVLNRTDDNRLLLSHKICELQYFPYHSKSYKSINQVLDSQKYTFQLLRRAIRNNKMIIILRSEKLWLEAVPELNGNYCKLNSYQNVIISENNLGKADFEKLIELIKN
jgi:hypothetical protein